MTYKRNVKYIDSNEAYRFLTSFNYRTNLDKIGKEQAQELENEQEQELELEKEYLLHQ